MVLEVLMVVGVLLLPVPALVTGAGGLLRHTGRSIDVRADRVEFGLLVVGRAFALMLLVALSGITLLSCVGGLIRDRAVPSLVYVFFVADLLIAVLVVLTFGRRDRQRARRPTSPAPR